MLNKDQVQTVSDGAVAVQATGNVTINNNYGPSVEDFRRIALDVYNENFYKLASEASEIAKTRASCFIDKFLERLMRVFPDGLKLAKDPDFLYVLFGAQRDFARSGNDQTGDLLVDLLVDRSKCCQRDLTAIVLNEAVAVAPMLTKEQLAALSVAFLVKHTRDTEANSLEKLCQLFDDSIQRFAPDVTCHQACYQHLEYAGCASMGGHIRIGALPFGSIILENYPDVFSGVNRDLVEAQIIESRPYMKEIANVWNNSLMKFMVLTSVGITLAHTNISRFGAGGDPLSAWMN